MKKAFWHNVILAASGIAFLFLAWAVVALSVGNPLLLPGVVSSFKALGNIWTQSAFWTAFLWTLLRVVVAFVCALILGGGCAVVAYMVPSFERFFSPIIAFFRALPVLGVLLIVLLWTNSFIAPIVVAVLSLFPIIYTGALTALGGVDEKLIEMSKVYKVPKAKQWKYLYLPSLLPTLLKESGAALGFGVKLVVSAEVLTRTKDSLGNWMQEAQLLEIPTLFALILTAVAIAFLLETVCVLTANALERGRK